MIDSPMMGDKISILYNNRFPGQVHWFSFGNVKSSEFNVILTDVKICGTPKRDYTIQTVAGRNGDLTLDNHRWNNIDITYCCAIATDFAREFDAFKSAFLSKTGYWRIEDSIYPGHFRLGMLKGEITPETRRKMLTGKFDVTFSCKPQRYLKDGENFVNFLNPGSLVNNTVFSALPIIKVFGTGAGTVSVGGITVQIKELSGSLILDCELQNAYMVDGAGAIINKNASIYAPEFPVLNPGENTVSWFGGIQRLEITPRWWIL